jgi:cytoskeletal protein RodZ
METIGQQLKQSREERHLTFKKVTQATHIQARLIEAMEDDDFESLPSPVQARAFLRLYAEFLELNLDDLIARQRGGVEQLLPASINLDPVPDQGRVQKAVPEVQAATRSAAELPKSKPANFQVKVKGLIQGIRQNLPQTNAAPPIIETIEQSQPSEPELIAAPPARTIATQEELSGLTKIEDFYPSGQTFSGQPASQLIFASIGEALQQRRETLSLTLDEIENHTHVRKHYLQALEAGDFHHLPSSVQTRGMLSNYARFLDMDLDALLLQFAEGLQAQRLERQPVAPKETPKTKTRILPNFNLPPGLRNYFSLDVFVGVGLILILLGFAIWGTSRIIGLRSAVTPQATALSISDILVASPVSGTPTNAPTNAAGTQAVVPAVDSTVIVTIPAAGQGPVQVVLVALDQAFVRVTVDGKKLFDGRVSAGTAYPFDGNSQIEVLTGNGAAVSVLFNQSDLGPLGTIGEVVDRIYTSNAILNPTATSTSTPTITPIPSATPRFSSTPSPTNATATPKGTQAGQ